MTRAEIVELMARAIHASGYTDSFDSLNEGTKENLRDNADAALEALEDAGLVEVTA